MALAAALLLLAAGCKREEIKVYSVPKDSVGVAAAVAPEAGDHKVRTLAVMAEQGGMVWFFKMRGPDELVAREKDHFVQFLQTAQFPAAGEQADWKVPEGWQALPASGMRRGTFVVKSGEGDADVSVIPLPPAASSELDNVNRWRRELQLPPIQEAEIKAEDVQVGSVRGRLFDLAGTVALNGAPPAMGPMMASAPFAGGGASVGGAASSGSLPSWNVPDGWKSEPASSMVLAAFGVGDGQAAQARVTVTQAGGSVLANVNRWRGQLGLAAIQEKDLPQLTAKLDLADDGAILADMSGQSPLTGKPARMVAVMVPRDGEAWFYKLMGDAAAVEAQKGAFVSFVKSAKYSK